MHNIDIKTKIRNPDKQMIISVPQFDSLDEAIRIQGRQHCLKIINNDAVLVARAHWRDQIIRGLHEKSRANQEA